MSNLVYPDGSSALAPVPDRIRARTTISESGCWEWQGFRDRDGYGKLAVGGVKKYAHRASYEAFIGPIPVGLTIDHLCRVRHCVNPGHLEPVTRAENTRRGEAGKWRAFITSCYRGHEFTPENTGRDIRGDRFCRQCDRDRDRPAARRRRAAKKAAAAATTAGWV